jgi:hypothetical protein
MTREDIVRMAKEAGMESFNICVELDDFAALVASAEREACAKVCEDSVEEAGDELAWQIRARGKA